jgi:hypothetical protein
MIDASPFVPPGSAEFLGTHSPMEGAIAERIDPFQKIIMFFG